MKGQASLETMFILASVLIIVTGFIVQGEGSNNSINAVSAARTGVENAINELEMEKNVKIEIEDIKLTENDKIEIDLTFWGGSISSNSIEQYVQSDALNYLYQAFNGSFPDEPGPVSTSRHEFSVNVVARRLKR